MNVSASPPFASGLLVGSPEFKQRAHELYAELREKGPIHRMRFAEGGLEGWLVVGYELAREALTHPDLLKDSSPAEEMLAAAGITTHHADDTGIGGSMFTSDGSVHDAQRAIVALAFTPARIKALAPRISEVAHALIDTMAPLGRADLMASFAEPLPVTIVSEFLGVPEGERREIRSYVLAAMDNPSPAQREGIRRLNQRLRQLLDSKRQHPGDDLFSTLVAQQGSESGALDDTQLLGNAALMVVAGFMGPVNLLGSATLALLLHPDQALLLRRQPELIPNAVEELLRYDSPMEFTPMRIAARELTLGGVTIPRGGLVSIAFASAARDASSCPHMADLDALRVTRTQPRHLSFGHGIHRCLAAPLGRLMATTALHALLTRIPDVALDIAEDEIPWQAEGIARGPLLLPVRFTPSHA